jgi:hypothetical protein
MKHVENGSCPYCHKLLMQGHPDLVEWFDDCAKRHFPTIHVCCVYRNQADQDDAFRRGASDKKWPHSKHNSTPATACDLFFQERGKARWTVEDYEALWQLSLTEGYPIRWGGTWDDNPHYELR